MIPKIIHYIWVGPKKMPDFNKWILDNNNFYLRGYQVKIWSENNYDVKKNAFLHNAYLNKKWAFVSDFMRFDILYEYGGIYLDTDMELIRPLDSLLELKAFSAFGDIHKKVIYCGAIGCSPKDKLISDIIDYYCKLNSKTGTKIQTSPEVFTHCHNHSNEKDYTILNYESFYPIAEGVKNYKRESLVNTYGIHHWDESWVSFLFMRRILRRIGFIKFYHSMLLKIKLKK